MAEPARKLDERLLDYAVRVIRVVAALPRKPAAKHIGDQLLRSGTAPGALYEEASAAESSNDFLHKMQIALKEQRESLYWLRVLHRSGLIAAKSLAAIIDEAEQLRAMLSKAVARAKGTAK